MDRPERNAGLTFAIIGVRLLRNGTAVLVKAVWSTLLTHPGASNA
jgi:hypothetical protein